MNKSDLFAFVKDLVFVNKDQKKLIKWLHAQRLLASTALCSKCGLAMRLVKKSDCPDKCVWNCWRCGIRCSIRRGSIFANFSKTSLQSILQSIYWWCAGLKVSQTRGLQSHKVTSQLSRILCEIIRDRFDMSNKKLDGTIAVDESLFTRRKYNRGSRTPQRWVFGMKDLATGRALMVQVSNRSSDELLPVIYRHVVPGSTIVSDCWSSYHCLGHPSSQYLHLTVNHSRHFKDPTTGRLLYAITHGYLDVIPIKSVATRTFCIAGAHTNHVEGLWSAVKRFIRDKSVKDSNDLSLWLNVYMWKNWSANSDIEYLFISMLNCIIVQYDLQ